MEPFTSFLLLFIFSFTVRYLTLQIRLKISLVSALSAAVVPKTVLIFVRDPATQANNLVHALLCLGFRPQYEGH